MPLFLPPTSAQDATVAPHSATRGPPCARARRPPSCVQFDGWARATFCARLLQGPALRESSRVESRSERRTRLW
eukprot:190400-Pyramimonas_sp.AAC.1